MTATGTKRRPTRGRKIVIAALVLGGLLVAADFGLAAAGEYQVAQKMRDKFRLSEDPSVRINGFPFTAQALAGDYRDIEISATGVPVADQLRDLEIRANLYHVRIGLSDLLSGNTRDAKIDQVRGSVKIQAADLNRLVDQVTPFSDMAIEPDTRTEPPAGQAPNPTVAAVKLSGTTTVASREIRIAAYGTVSLVNGQVAIAINDVELDDTALAGLDAVLGVVREALSVTIDPGVLPFTVTPTAVKVESGAFTVEGTINDIPLDQQ
ncbi:LmeA family phospholipid-binding protein [Saccharothrix sp. Mg75]|uniref:LmeA family phospholipid-binding protein n=1 Tax=Saccharothrix sp. Mg75 TaxID=3445357 RepID=UPI003EEFA5C0